jgi:periplasmic protein CpxP/Spy
MSEAKDRQAGGEQPTPQPRSRRRFLAGILTGGLLGSLLAGGVSLYAHAQPGPGWWWGAGRSPGGYLRQAASNAEMLPTRIEFATDWILSRIEASDAQRQQVKAIVQATVQDLMPMRAQHRQNRQALLQALAQPTIDRATLGDIRHAALQLADTASEQIVTALADVAEVLTPEQRIKLLEFTSRWHH